MTEPIETTRKELYDAVWVEPIHAVAKRFGMSDRGLAKLCERFQVPSPGRGYWARKAAGQKVHRPRLPTMRDDPGAIVILPGAIDGVETGPVADQHLFESREENGITVPERVSNYHPLVRGIRAFGGSRRPWSYEGPELNVRVGNNLLGRAKRLMHALIKALERRGFTMVVRAGRTFITVNGIDVEVQLREPWRRVDLSPTDPRWREWHTSIQEPTGTLLLQIICIHADGTQKIWADGKREKLEDRLNDFMVGLVAAAEAEREREREREIWRQEWEEQERIRRAQLRAAEEERVRREATPFCH